MKIRDFYRNSGFIAGVLLTVAGAVNWTLGLARTHHYQRVAARSASNKINEDGLDQLIQLDPASRRAVLRPLTAEQHKVSYASTHMDFYYAVFLTGQAMFVIGVAVTLIAFLVALRRDTKGALKRTRESAGKSG